MNCLRIDNTVLNLDTITRISFEQNDKRFRSDDRCHIYFVGSINDPLVFRGEKARSIFDQIAEKMGLPPQ